MTMDAAALTGLVSIYSSVFDIVEQTLSELLSLVIRHCIGRKCSTGKIPGLDLVAKVSKPFIRHVTDIRKYFTEFGNMHSMVRMVE